MARPFKRARNHALVFGAGASFVRREYFGVRRHKFTHKLRIFIIDIRDMLAAKSAGSLFYIIGHIK